MKTTNHDRSRRDFLKTGVSGLAGAAIIPTLAAGGSGKPENSQTAKIITRKLGKTGIELPILSIGGGSCWDKTIYEAAIEKGIKHIDTSELYQNGNHERLVGEVMKGRKRDSIVIATSYYFRLGRVDHTAPATVQRAKAFDLAAALEASLKRLELDYVDTFYVAGIASKEVALIEEHLNALQKLKKDGKTRFVGMATHQNEHVVLRAAADGKVHDAVMAQYNHLQPHKEEVKKAVAYAANAGVGVVAMKTQAGGRVPNHKAALKWVLQDENVCTAVPTMKNLDQLNAHLPVLEGVKLTAEEKAALEGGAGASAQSYFCAYCEKCVPQCPYNVDIPSLMRSYMYAYGHKNLWLAKEYVKSIDFASVPCGSCETCSVNCSMGFDIKTRVQDVAWVKNVPDDFLI